MKVKVKKKDLENIIPYLSLIKASPIPILNTILLKTNKNKLTFIRSDSSIFVKCSIDAEIEEEGNAVFQYELLAKSKAYLPTNIEFSTSQDKIKIGKYSFPLYSVEEFPELPKITPKEEIMVEKNLKEIISFTGDKSSYALDCVCIDKNFITATDGRRLVALKEKRNIENKILLYSYICKFNIDKIEVGNNGIKIYINENIKIYQPYLGDNYPDIEKVIPPDYSNYFLINTRELKERIKACKILDTSFNESIKLIVSKESLKIEKESDKGSFKDEIDCDSTKEFAIAFNTKYFLDFLDIIEEEGPKIYFKDSNSPIKYENSNKVALLLPIIQ